MSRPSTLICGLLLCGLAAGCPAKPRPQPRPRVQAKPLPPPRCAPGQRAQSRIALPPDGCHRYLQGSAPLPLPADAITVHLELEALRKSPDSRRVLAGAWDNLRADSAAAGQLWPYLKGCGVTPHRDLTAVTLSQPLVGRPDTDRVVVLWGLLMAQRIVACLERAMEAHGAKTRFLPAGGEPAFSADRQASDLHLDAVALDSSTLLVASGAFRRTVRTLMHRKGRSLATTPRYRRAVRSANAATLLLAWAPRLPPRMVHLQLPKDAYRYVRGLAFALQSCGQGCPRGMQMRLVGDLAVGDPRRARRWAAKAPAKQRLLSRLAPRAHGPLLRRLQITAVKDRLRLHLKLSQRDLRPLGSLLSRWLPW